VPGAIIQVVELDAPREAAAPLSVTTNKDGWFDIPGLDAGRWYRLVARARDGSRFLTGSTRVQCTNVRVAIALTGEEVIPPPTPPPSGDSPARTEAPRGDGDKPASPAAALGAPVIKSPSEGITTPLPGDEKRGVPGPATAPVTPAPATPSPAASSDPSLLATEEPKEKDGFIRRPPSANIEGPGRDAPKTPVEPYTPPPLPGSTNDPALETSPAPSAAPTRAPLSRAVQPRRPLVVPSCVRSGQTVEDFALLDFNGNVWELSKNRGSDTKLVLLDFWFTSCGPCCAALRSLVELDRKYRPYGLKIVGIAHEKGSFLEKQDAVRPLRSRYGINYTLLFSGGDTCPVIRQMEVRQYPTVFLLDGNGKIVWQATGMGENTKYSLEMEIRRRLGIR
jgi:peroxiredoxin